MHRIIIAFLLTLSTVACRPGSADSSPPRSREGYVGLIVDTQTHAVRYERVDSVEGWSVRLDDGPFVDVLDPAGRRADNIWLRDSKIFDWNQFKQLAETPAQRAR